MFKIFFVLCFQQVNFFSKFDHFTLQTFNLTLQLLIFKS